MDDSRDSHHVAVIVFDAHVVILGVRTEAFYGGGDAVLLDQKFCVNDLVPANFGARGIVIIDVRIDRLRSGVF
jgi:hypothetical protein